MNELDYEALYNEIESKLQKEESLILATCAENKVTARMMCHINYGLEILFSTNLNSEKVQQMQANPHVALAIDNLKIEAVVELYGLPDKHPSFGQDYAAKFPHLGGLYESTPEDLLVIARPTKIALYKYIDGPCEDVLLPGEKKAYRITL